VLEGLETEARGARKELDEARPSPCQTWRRWRFKPNTGRCLVIRHVETALNRQPEPILSRMNQAASHQTRPD
jgi:hypothetical protein